MNNPEKVTLHLVLNSHLTDRVRELARQVVDAPATCQHRAAVLVCAVHPGFGPACEPCMNEHLLSHALLDDVCCVLCGRVGADVLWGHVHDDDFAYLIRLCGPCREAP